MSQNWTMIWLDQVHDAAAVAETNSIVHFTLCKVDPYLVTFRDSKKCLNHIDGLQQEQNRIILIISSQTLTLSSNTLLERGEELPQIQSVYILVANNTDVRIFEGLSKVHGVYTDLESLCNQLRELPYFQQKRREGFLRTDINVKPWPHVRAPSSYTAAATTTNTEPLLSSSPSTIKRQEAEFMYAQLLRDILIKIESTEEEMIEFCRRKYANNETELNVIEEFQDYYDACNAIFWYTRDTFLYRLLNKALREQDIDTLYSLRYFIKDLHLQLKERHISQQRTSIEVIHTGANTVHSMKEVVYRGQLMSSEEFNRKIQYNIGGYFSVNSFFSTTSHENLASVYSGNDSSTSTQSEVQSVLFKIDIDKAVNKFPYANISKQSAFEDEESEILFTMGAVFRIESVDLNDQGIWIVQLKLTEEEDGELRTLTEHIRIKIIFSNSHKSLARLMVEIGNYTKAEQYYLFALQELTATYECKLPSSYVYNDLGTIYYELGQYKKALDHFEKALEILLEHLPPTHSFLAGTYSNVGNVCRIVGAHEKALLCFNKALEIELNVSDPDQSKLASYYNSIGTVYYTQRQYSDALTAYEKSLQLRLNSQPANHPSIAKAYTNLAALCFKLENYDKTVEYSTKSLQIEINSLPSNHSSFAITYNNLAQAFYKQGKLKEALDNMKKRYEVNSKNLPSDHPLVIHDLKVIAILENDIRQNKDVLSDVTGSSYL